MTSPVARTTFEHVVCLGCGCACDDVRVEVENGRIVAATPACRNGAEWFGDGRVPGNVLVEGRAADETEALASAAELLAQAAGRVLVYLAPDLTSEAQRAVLGLADLLRATVDSATSTGVAAGLVAAQRRGRAAATLGELKSRADLVVLWGVDPAERYGRFVERYVPAGARETVTVRVGGASGGESSGAGTRPVAFAAADEVAALTVMRATIAGTMPPNLPPALSPAVALAQRMAAACYVVIVSDGESGNDGARDSRRSEALIALAQALNAPTRAALITLRAGGNRAGADMVMTSQTGYPFAIDYSSGRPRYTPDARGLDRVGGGGFTAVLIAGSATDVAGADFAGVPSVIIGPGASESRLGARVAIDTGRAGVHEAGTGYRLDDVPLPLTAVLPSPRSARETIAALTRLVAQRLRKETR